MRSALLELVQVKRDLERLSARRAECWKKLGVEHSRDDAARLAVLNRKIDELWDHHRTLIVRARHGSTQDVMSRARGDESLERDLRRRMSGELGIATLPAD